MLNDLLNYGADINAKNGDGNTTLHVAISDELTEVVKCFLNHGAYMDKTDNSGWTLRDLKITKGMKKYWSYSKKNLSQEICTYVYLLKIPLSY